ncbi:MAG TPA: TetR/AcrR family transcriptional regulator [Xanthobacteraceae bacterium]|nr:TetR/AcrR family transcriptional regulator [Xanthobacteraceae bacterium]
MAHLDAQLSAILEPSTAGQDPEKRRQILDGARAVFLTHGFERASMGEISRTANVSKGTLYVYFGSKQDLFAALVHEECAQTAERTVVFDDTMDDVQAALMSVGRNYVRAMTRPEHIATVRTVIAVAEKFPEVGTVFLRSGLLTGVARLAAWLRCQVGRGRLALDDPDLAAAHFLVGCHGVLVLPMLFAGSGPPAETEIEQAVAHSVGVFLRACAPSCAPCGTQPQAGAPSPASNSADSPSR